MSALRRRSTRAMLASAVVIAGVGGGVALAASGEMTVSPESPTVDQAVTFNAVDTCDGIIVTCAWSFDDGTPGATGQSATHPPVAVPNTQYKATLTVTELLVPDPTTSTRTVTVQNRAPTVGAIGGPATAPVGTAVTFSAAGNDPDHFPVTYHWTIDGVAQPETGATLPGRTPSVGAHTIAVSVTDPHGGSASAPSKSFTVTNAPPTVPSVSGPSVVQIDGAPSGQATFTTSATDPEGSAVTFQWKVDGIVSSDNDASFTPTLTGGSHTIAVAARDAQGLLSADSAPKTVLMNRSPSVSAIGGAATVQVGASGTTAQVSLSATGSDPDPGQAPTFHWTVDNVAQADADGSFTPTLTAGLHTIKVNVTDGNGGTSADVSKTVFVNRPPKADFSWSPTVVEKNDDVIFSSKSIDPDGKPLTQVWDLDGDGSFDDGFGDTATRRYADTKKRSIGLRVSDPDGGTAEVHLDLVPGDKPPKAAFTASPASPTVNQTVTFTSTSTDPDGKVAKLDWDLDGDGSFGDGTGGTASRSYATAGLVRVGLKATDEEGSSDVAYVNVDVLTPAGVSVAPKVTTASTKTSAKVLKPFPKVRYAGRLTAGGARISVFSVVAPKGSRVAATCRKGCPDSKVARTARTVRLKSLQGSYRAGAVLEVRVTKGKTIGKYTRIQIMKGKAPRRQDLCLWPNAKKPKKCPAGADASASAG